ncbi:hypothetical protein [Dyadobacter sp. Leaf189]|uniref:hypothetical protein n=1 Tax=Dyadobacter sp. Leaf189 TaxID=1736295 RepID=UPI0006FC302F|nr:hypothetical protein [Dyadobacter sp. Leaf189]KQS33248.1 hypothetical protein ASG33_03965 [Dyadobacter sp. Leaf189]
MKMYRKLSSLLFLGLAMSFTQCKDSGEDLQPDDENELITSVTLNFKEDATGTVTSFSYKDADGDGGNAPTKFDTVALKANTKYTMTIEFLDESKTPADNITEEIREESDEHLLVYTPAPASLLTYTYGDKDENNFNVGLTGTVQTGPAGTGNLKVQLRHQPEGKNGSPTIGSDDANLDFVLKVQ